MIGNQNVRISDQGELRLRAVGELRLRAIGEQRNVAAAKLLLPATSPSAARSTGIQKEVNSAHWSVAERWLFGKRHNYEYDSGFSCTTLFIFLFHSYRF